GDEEREKEREQRCDRAFHGNPTGSGAQSSTHRPRRASSVRLTRDLLDVGAPWNRIAGAAIHNDKRSRTANPPQRQQRSVRPKPSYRDVDTPVVLKSLRSAETRMNSRPIPQSMARWIAILIALTCGAPPVAAGAVQQYKYGTLTIEQPVARATPPGAK